MSTTTDQDYSIFNNYYSNNVEVENKKKKASRACLHCQRAHLTCDDSRPCQRCIKRDLANTCTDAVRKRAKYLEDLPVDELFDSTTANNQQASTYNDSTSIGASTSQEMFNSDNPFDLSLSDMGFGSATIGLEYDFISTMLQNPLLDMTENLNNATSTTTASAAATTAPLHLSTVSMQQMMNHDLNNNVFHINNNIPPTPTTSATFFNNTSSPYLQQPVTPIPQNKPSPLADSPTLITTTKRASNASTTSTTTIGRRKGYGNTPEEAYTSVRKPFNYAEGFHYLIQYVREKMGRDDLMRISRALALFRPSFLALIMNLTEEDLVFMEKCIQRTLLEYEKLVSFSGTPTVVWRRTGEICLVGKEFSLLTQWTKDMLLGKKVYIYELMDRKSAVEYWEKFSTHAFDNTDKSCIYSCTITTPQQKHVPCTFCFTIKRDIFDLPSVIIGNFLPILS